MGVATVAVLFTDLSGSTATAEALGPTAADRARREHFDALRTAIRQHDGTEVKSTGDGLMVVFGSPSGAVACAAAMQLVNQSVRQAPGDALRIGLSVGEATNEDGDWFGMPVVRAARLCDAAGPGEVYVDQLVASLAARAEARFEGVGDLELKGISQPIPTLLLRWEAAAPAVPLPSALGASGVFVGRVGLLDAIDRAFEQVDDAGTRLFLLGGEPGAGKTSIAAEFARTAHDRGTPVLFGRCSSGPGLAYQPFVQAVGHLVRHADDGLLARHVAIHGGELARLSEDLPARVPDLAPPVTSDPATEQWRLFEAVRGLLAEAGQARPVVLVLDDLHWASAPALQLLTHLLHAEAGPSALIVATYRDTELARTHPLADVMAELRRLDLVERASIGGLGLDETIDLVEAAAGEDLDDEGRALAGEVHQRTEGNPFFVVELLRHLVESGAVVHRDGRWAAGEVDEGLPEGVKEVVGRRLRRLSPEANQLLAVAAVVGLEFELDIVARVSGLDPEVLFEPLDEARAAGILQELAPRRYGFTHALIRSTVGDEAGVSRQAHLHGKVADAMEELYGDRLEPWLADLAFHHAEAAHATRTQAAVDFALRAAAQARAQAAVDEAESILQRALVVTNLAEPPDDEQVARLLVALSETTVMVEPLRAKDFAMAAADAAARIGGKGLVAASAASLWSVFNSTIVGSVAGDRWLIDLCERAIVSDVEAEPAARSRVLAMAVLLRWWRPEAVDVDRADEAVRLALTVDDPVAQLVAAEARLMARWFRGPSAQLWADFVAVVDRVVASTPDAHLRGMAGVYLSWGASGAGDRTRFDEALALVEESAAVVRGPRMPSWALWLRAMIASREGDWRKAVALAEEARRMTIDPTIGDTMIEVHLGAAVLHEGDEATCAAVAARPPAFDAVRGAGVDVFRIVMHALAGDHAQAKEGLREVIAENRLDGDPARLVSLGLASYAAVLVGDVESACVLEAELRPYCGFMCAGGMAELGSVDRHVAAAAALDGRDDEADALFRSGLEIEEGFGEVALAAHTRYWWAKCLLHRRAEGDAEHATELLDACLATADRLGMKKLAADALALRS